MLRFPEGREIETFMNGQPTRLIVGIGNPGARYVYTRHNVGFLVVQAFSEKYGLDFRKKVEIGGVLAKGVVKGAACCILKPSTYVNLSGESVAKAKRFLGVDISNILVVVDDVDIPFGVIRLRERAGSGGHNGIKSITSSLGGNTYFQLRVGVGRPEGLSELSDYVLGNFSLVERERLVGVFDRTSAMILEWIAARPAEE
ncbi:aminoacyl-tRNA hydrolase [Chlamydiifrater volucris]|uniref:aminoacyl-tRNA hydrolase n=1 Tax=Chlamydiifrater volucris TaxID=2681470 RepID=UPI001BCF658F|nr:aminoacyl-tRNA hydrolase [Chlamydiifrater volucris]